MERHAGGQDPAVTLSWGRRWVTRADRWDALNGRVQQALLPLLAGNRSERSGTVIMCHLIWRAVIMLMPELFAWQDWGHSARLVWVAPIRCNANLALYLKRFCCRSGGAFVSSSCVSLGFFGDSEPVDSGTQCKWFFTLKIRTVGIKSWSGAPRHDTTSHRTKTISEVSLLTLDFCFFY